MSVIAAMCSSRTASTWVASDTLVSSGNLRLSVGPKWLIRDSWAVGVAGHVRTINVFQRHAEELLKGLGDAYEFSRRARDLLRADGYGSAKEDLGPCDFGQMLMVATPHGVWTIGSDFSVSPIPVDFLWAEGSGRDLAIGAAHALRESCPEISAKDVLRRAVETAIACDVGCGGEAWVSEIAASERP
jgi:ATP-dependent protease HslVU (ClpYQ) peptidase subunit